MSNFSLNILGLSFALTTVSTIGGWALTDKLAGYRASQSFLFVGLSIVIAITAVQIILYLLGKNRLFYRILFAGALSLTMLWFMLCLIFPILLTGTIPITEKAAISFLTTALSVCNVTAAFGQFKGKWQEKGQGEFAKFYKERDREINWERATKPMNLAAALYIPGVPSRATPIVSAIIIFSMLLGFSFRNVFPTFSIFAWGIPASIIISIFVQMMGLSLAQALKIRELEKKLGNLIRPTTKPN